MANPFFIPRRRRPIDVASLGLQLMALKQRGDIAKGSQALTEKEQALRGRTIDLAEKTHGKVYGETKLTGRPKRPGQTTGGLVEERIPGIKEPELIKARQLADWETGMKKEPDMAALDGAIDRFGAEVSLFKEIQSNVMAGRETGKVWQRSDSYKLAKQKKVMGEFGVYAENLNKKAFGLEKKGDYAKAKPYRELAKEIVRPGFIDDFYQVPESLRTKATGSLEEFEAKEAIKAKYKAKAAAGDKIPPKVKHAQDLIKSLTPNVSGGTAALLAGLVADFNVDAANKLRDEIPEQLKPIYNKAVKILEGYYKADTTNTRFILRDGKLIKK